MKTYDVVVIGAGSSGMEAGLKASSLNSKTLIIERDKMCGGILNQCIHNGFGLSYFKEELTGPEYANKLFNLVKEKNIDLMLSTFVTKVDTKNNTVTISSKNGKEEIKYKALVLATGCRERTAGQINLLGDRPSGVWTAGLVQKMINHYGKIPGREAIILGSGDIGLIMARRLTLEGVKVKAVLEIKKESMGLKRNIRQCLEDFNIPLLLSHTITRVIGNGKIEGVYISKVDENLKPIKETEEYIKCDTVLLSVGLIPENELLENQIEMDKKTKSAIVNEYRQSSIDNVFVSGNVLHIHDLADNATIEGSIAGTNASFFASGKLKRNKEIFIEVPKEISYIIPQKVQVDASDFSIYFRVKEKQVMKKLVLKNNDEIIATKFLHNINPGEMQEFKINNTKILENLKLEVL